MRNKVKSNHHTIIFYIMAEENQQNRPMGDAEKTSQTQNFEKSQAEVSKSTEPRQTEESEHRAEPQETAEQQKATESQKTAGQQTKEHEPTAESEQPAEEQETMEPQEAAGHQEAAGGQGSLEHQKSADSQQPTAEEPCKCPEINPAEWDKQKKHLNKTFYKAFSPRILGYPFSFVIDLDRATRGAKGRDYQVPETPMIMDTGGLFLGHVMVEVTEGNADDPNIVDLKGKDLYTKIAAGPKSTKNEVEGLKAEIGVEPTEVYYWWVSCPKCDAKKESKAIIIAVLPQGQPEPQEAQEAQEKQEPHGQQDEPDKQEVEQPVEQPEQQEQKSDEQTEQPEQPVEPQKKTEQSKQEQPAPPEEEPKQEQPTEEPAPPAEEPKEKTDQQ